jgi:hypothetical protein
MPNLAQGGVTVVGLGQETKVTFYLNSAIVQADVGKAVKVSAANTVNLLAEDDLIFGVLTTFENRVQEGVKTGAVGLKGGYRFTYETGDTVAVGDSIVAAPAGEVKKAGAANNTKVIAVNATDRTVDVWIS